MASGPKKWTEEVIADRIAKGRGQGDGDSYVPWIFVQEFSSRGVQTRIPSFKMKRTVHTMSYLERYLFLHAEFQEEFVCFREQFPMARAITLGAAAALGIKHPVYRGTNVPVVMTLDGVLTMRDHNNAQRLAGWDAKPASQLLVPRVLAKLSLHKAFCAHAGMSHYIFTENSLPKNVIRNIDWLRMSLPKDGESPELESLDSGISEQLLAECKARSKHCRAPTISNFCKEFDQSNRFGIGD